MSLKCPPRASLLNAQLLVDHLRDQYAVFTAIELRVLINDNVGRSIFRAAPSQLTTRVFENVCTYICITYYLK